MNSRIACSPLTGNIHLGRVNKQGTAFTGEKRDVTSDVLGAVIEKARFHGGKFDVQDGLGNSWIVEVSKQPVCTCPSGNGSLKWPCPVHPPAEEPRQ